MPGLAPPNMPNMVLHGAGHSALFLQGHQGQTAAWNFLGHHPTMETSWEEGRESLITPGVQAGARHLLLCEVWILLQAMWGLSSEGGGGGDQPRWGGQPGAIWEGFQKETALGAEMRRFPGGHSKEGHLRVRGMKGTELSAAPGSPELTFQEASPIPA